MIGRRQLFMTEVPESGSCLVVIARSSMIRGLGADELAHIHHLELGGRGLLRLQRNRESGRFNKKHIEMITTFYEKCFRLIPVYRFFIEGKV